MAFKVNQELLLFFGDSTNTSLHFDREGEPPPDPKDVCYTPSKMLSRTSKGLLGWVVESHRGGWPGYALRLDLEKV